MNDLLVLSDPVRAALAANRPVVALETSVLAQGLPHPRNLEAKDAMTEAVRAHGAEPAWVSIERGSVVVGATEDALDALCSPDVPKSKVARRDIPMVVSSHGLGGTTVSATLWAAGRVGIEVAATGGIGGVHRGSDDVSADLVELGRTAGTLVCSGPKSIVDPAATLERLEELGVAVLGYRCRKLPFFVATETDLPLEHHADTVGQIAGAARVRRALGIESTLLVCQPVPRTKAIPLEILAPAIDACLARADREDLAGKDVTPFLLACVSERTRGASLEANLALLESNTALAAQIAVELC